MNESKYCRQIIPIVLIIWSSIGVVLSQLPTQANQNEAKATPQKESKFPSKIPDILENALLGKVRFTKDLSYIPELKFEKWEIGKPFMILDENYDLDGYYTSSALNVYSGVETIADKAFRELDNHFFSDSADARVSTVNFSYDYESKIIFKERKVGDSANVSDSIMQIEKSSTKYSVGGTTEFDAEGKITWKEIVTNERDGRKITTVYGEDGSIIERTTGKGNETVYENMEYGSGWKERSFMNNSDHVTERLSIDGKKKPWVLDKKTIRSSMNDQIVETEIYISQGKEYLRLVRVYKKIPKVEIEYMQIVKMPHKNADGDPAKSYHFKYEYKFDSTGNWMEKTELNKVSKFGRVMFEPFRIVQREISYYR